MTASTPQVRKRYVDPIVYKVGTDISAEDYHEAITKIADWFVEFRNTKEPALLAKQLFQECLDGVTANGSPWFAAANATLASRVRIKCRFDIVKMEPLRTASEKRRERKDKEKQSQAIKKEKQKKDLFIPDEIRKDLQREIKYGDDPSAWMTTAEQKNWNQLFIDYQKQHPELMAVSALEELKMVCDTHIIMERFRMQQLAGKQVDQAALDATVKRFTSLKKSLGIHPDQVKNKTKGTLDASVGEAVSRFASMGEHYLNLRKRMWLEELIQMYQMYCTPRADGKGYQLDAVGLYGLTRTKPEPCPKCQTLVYGGLSIEEIEEYLIRKGALEPLEEESSDENTFTNTEGDRTGSAGSDSGTEDRGGDTASDPGSVAA